MSTKFVRQTRRPGRTTVLVVSTFLNPRDKPRECPKCEAKWAAELDSEGIPQVWRNGVEEQRMVLDWSGNNVVIECCTEADLPV